MSAPQIVYFDIFLNNVITHTGYKKYNTFEIKTDYVKTFLNDVLKPKLIGTTINEKIIDDIFTHSSDQNNLVNLVKYINDLPEECTVWMNMYGYTEANPTDKLVIFPIGYSSTANTIHITAEGFRQVLQYIKPSIRIFITIDAWFGGSLGFLRFLYNGTNTLNPYIHNPHYGFPRVYADVVILASSSMNDSHSESDSIQANTLSQQHPTYIEYDINGFYKRSYDNTIPFFTYSMVEAFNYILNKTNRVPTVFDLYFEILKLYDMLSRADSSMKQTYPVIVSERALDLQKYVFNIYEGDKVVAMSSEALIQSPGVRLVPNSYRDEEPKKTLIGSANLENIEAFRAVKEDAADDKELAIVNVDRTLFRYLIYRMIEESDIAVLSVFLDSIVTNYINPDDTANALKEELYRHTGYTGTTNLQNPKVKSDIKSICSSAYSDLSRKLGRLKPADLDWHERANVYSVRYAILSQLTLLYKIDNMRGEQFIKFEKSSPILRKSGGWSDEYNRLPLYEDPSTLFFTLHTASNTSNLSTTLENFNFSVSTHMHELMINSNNLFDLQNTITSAIADINVLHKALPGVYRVQRLLEKSSVLDSYVLRDDGIPQYNSGLQSMGWTVCEMNTYDEDIDYHYLLKVSLDTSAFIHKKIIKELYLDCDLYPPKGAPFPLELYDLAEHLPDSLPNAKVSYYHNANSNTLLKNSFYFSNINDGNCVDSSNTDLFLMAVHHPTSNLLSPIESSYADFRVTVANMSNVFLDLDTDREHFQEELNFNIQMLAVIRSNIDQVYNQYIVDRVKENTTKEPASDTIDHIDFSKHVLRFHKNIVDERDPYLLKNPPFENFNQNNTANFTLAKSNVFTFFDSPSEPFNKHIEDFQFALTIDTGTFYDLSNLFYTPMNTFSDLYSVKSNNSLFISWRDDRNLFPIYSNQYKSLEYSNMLLTIPFFHDNSGGASSDIRTALKVNKMEPDYDNFNSRINISNFEYIAHDQSLETYIQELRTDSKFLANNMSNTQRFRFETNLGYQSDSGTTDVWEPLSNITAETFRFPYYKCYTIPKDNRRAPVDLKVDFNGSNYIFNSNCEMFWYDANTYDSLLELRDGTNTLSLRAKTAAANMTEGTKSNIFYIGGIPEGDGNVRALFDFESSEIADILHMDQEIVTLCNLTYFDSNYSAEPAMTAHEMFLSMSHRGFSNLVFNKSFDLNTDLYDSPARAASTDFRQYQLGYSSDPNLYMWYSNTAANGADLSFQLSNSRSYSYESSDFYDPNSHINHMAIATNGDKKSRVRINTDSRSSAGSNVFMVLNTQIDATQYVYQLYNRDSIALNLTRPGSYMIDQTHYLSVSSIPSYPLVLPPEIGHTNSITYGSESNFDLNYNHSSGIFRTLAFELDTEQGTPQNTIRIRFGLIGEHLKFSVKPVRNYKMDMQVDQRVEIESSTEHHLFVSFYNKTLPSKILFAVCVETEMLPTGSELVTLGTLYYKIENYSLLYISDASIESDTFPYQTDLY